MEEEREAGTAWALRQERRLVRRLLDGDARAFEAFVERYFPGLYRFAMCRLGSAQAVDEVVQIVLEIAARRLETWRGEAPLHGWLLGICRREIQHYHQRVRRDREMMTPFLGDEAIRSVVERVRSNPAEEPEAAAQRSELLLQIGRVLDRLPENQALALELMYMEGHSSQEIAARLGLSDVATQSLLARARRAFRAAFVEERPVNVPVEQDRDTGTAAAGEVGDEH